MTRQLRAGHDSHVHRAALAVMFRNPVDLRVVHEGLSVGIQDAQQAHAAVQPLYPNGWGVYVAHHLAGWRGTQAAGAAQTRRYTLSVEDRNGIYLPLTAQVALPVEGLLDLPWAATLAGAAGAGLPHIPLQHASSSSVPAGLAEVRLDLCLASDGAPASWARVELWLQEPERLLARGLADARGSALLVSPLPAPQDPPLRASPGLAPAAQNHWTVRLRAFWNHAMAQVAVPDLSDLARLPEVGLLQARATSARLAPAQLTAGLPLVIRSAGSSCVFVDA